MPILARSVGFLPVFFPPEGSLRHGPVEALPLPVDADHVVVLVQGVLPELAEHAPLLPAREVAVEAAPRTELGRGGLPLTAGPQDVEDPVEYPAVRQGRATALTGSPHPRQERFDPLPQRVRDAKRLNDSVSSGGHDDSPQRANRWALTLYPQGFGIGSESLFVNLGS